MYAFTLDDALCMADCRISIDTVDSEHEYVYVPRAHLGTVPASDGARLTPMHFWRK